MNTDHAEKSHYSYLVRDIALAEGPSPNQKIFKKYRQQVTDRPTVTLTAIPTMKPTSAPTTSPTSRPTKSPTDSPSSSPSTVSPTSRFLTS